MNEIVLDFSGIGSLWELHEYLKETLGLPEYYGHNLDALWDCLSYRYDSETTILLRNLDTLPEALTERAEVLCALFQELREQDGFALLVENDASALPLEPPAEA